MTTQADRSPIPVQACFTPAGEVVADDRARVPLAKAGVERDTRYAVSKSDDGDILLTPLSTIPTRELWFHRDPEARASLLRGLADSAAGRVVSLGSFTQYLDDDEKDGDAKAAVA